MQSNCTFDDCLDIPELPAAATLLADVKTAKEMDFEETKVDALFEMKS